MAELQTGPLTGEISDCFSGVETLDLSVADPKPTANFSLKEYSGARFQPVSPGVQDADSWLIEPGGYLQFKLTLPNKHGLVFTCELGAAVFGVEQGYPINIEANGTEWTPDLDLNSHDFQRQSWYLLHYQLEQGENRITLRLAPDACAPVLLRSASVMRFNLQMQQQTKWCWAAVTTSLLRFFYSDMSLTQCQVVRKCFGQQQNSDESGADCCQSGDSELCNKTFKLSQALEAMGILESYVDSALPLKEIRRQISAGVPLAIRIGWRDRNGNLSNSGHFVMLTAVGPDDPRGDDHAWVRVADPKDKVASYTTYETLKNNYKCQGQWTHTYLIKKEEPSAPAV
jgi:hypothetical protein